MGTLNMAARAAVILISILMLHGCSIFSEPVAPPQETVKLSDVARVAAGDAKTVVAQPSGEPQVEDAMAEAALDAASFSSTSTRPAEPAEPTMATEPGQPMVSGLLFSSRDIAGHTSIGAIDQLSWVGYRDEANWAFGARVSLGHYRFAGGSPASAAIDSNYAYSVDLFARRYFTDPQALLSPYVTLGGGFGRFEWSYRRDVPTLTGASLRVDALEFIDLGLGIGLELGRSGRWRATLEYGPTGRIYNGRTGEGFENDLFPDHWSTALSGSLTYQF